MEDPHWIMQHRLHLSACRLCRNPTRAALSMPVTSLQAPHRLPLPMHARSEQTLSCATPLTPCTVMAVRLLLRYPWILLQGSNEQVVYGPRTGDEGRLA